MKKKILIVDDSALMRRVLCDIINSDDRFEVVNMATDGAEGFKYICEHTYDAVVLDVYMPRMTGIQMLEEMQKANVRAKVLMSSTTTGEGARETMDALALGAIDFIKKPENVANARNGDFRDRFLDVLNVVASMPMPQMVTRRTDVSSARPQGATFEKRYDVNFHTTAEKFQKDRMDAISKSPSRVGFGSSSATSQGVGSDAKVRTDRGFTKQSDAPSKSRKIVAIASSTGGPRALQDVIPLLPKDLSCPVLLVQHMPKGFTQSFAERLNELSNVIVSEAKDGDVLCDGHVYIAPGGVHMKVEKRGTSHYIKYSDEPTREGVKPCANYMYESLMNSDYDEVVCVVLTGMGADGTQGIVNLSTKKSISIISQDKDSCIVYGMPKCIAESGLKNDVVPLSKVTSQIIKNLGVM